MSIIFAFFVLASCSGLYLTADDPAIFTEEEWTVPDGPRQTLRDRTWDLHHQKLWVRFDFENEEVIGRTELLFSSDITQSELILDAKTMEFDRIYNVESGNSYSFRQDSAIVSITLEADFEPGDTLVIGIDFISSPPQRGLYFVNPRGEDPVKPTQIWTLGQPEDNSFWFPTIDHPAERATQETWISVPAQFTTLSNGLLQESRVKEGGSLRTDYWVMNYPHAPYLFVLAVGEYELTEEIRDDILYRYYTESHFVDTVELIYANTVDMIRFSEKKTGIPYPWDPVYAQAPVHDFIARGMENTTATLLYDAVQFDRRAALDLTNQDLIMHEIIHHWFGNLVTAKNWANLPLNEGFANYFESAYILYKDGRDDWLWKRNRDRMLYFDEAQSYRRPVIFDRYEIPEDMYDRHTYQKAGQIIGMLHDYLGDDVWWNGVQLWLERFSFSSVDIYDLQGVFEEVSNEDLDWFFDQWFLQPGHPYLDVAYEIEGGRVDLWVNQVQDTTRQPVFTLHADILVVFDNEETDTVSITLEKSQQHYVLIYEERNVTDIIMDPDKVQLAEYIVDLDAQNLIKRAQNDHVLVRNDALSMLKDMMEEPYIVDLLVHRATDDPFWGVRMQSFEILADNSAYLDPETALKTAKSAVYDDESNYRVRMEAIHMLRNMDQMDDKMEQRLKNHFIAMTKDPSYFVAAEAIRAIGFRFPDAATEIAGSFAGDDSYQDIIKNAVTDALIASDSDEARDILFMLANEPGDKTYPYSALIHLLDSASDLDQEETDRLIEIFTKRIEDPYDRYRLAAYQAMKELGAVLKLDALYEARDRNDISDSEREELKNAIRSLEYERDEIE